MWRQRQTLYDLAYGKNSSVAKIASLPVHNCQEIWDQINDVTMYLARSSLSGFTCFNFTHEMDQWC